MFRCKRFMKEVTENSGDVCPQLFPRNYHQQAPQNHVPYLTKKKSFKIKGFPENGGVLNITFINKIKGFVNIRGVFVNNNLKIIIEGL